MSRHLHLLKSSLFAIVVATKTFIGTALTFRLTKPFTKSSEDGLRKDLLRIIGDLIDVN